jgi:hypothetical protein
MDVSIIREQNKSATSAWVPGDADSVTHAATQLANLRFRPVARWRWWIAGTGKASAGWRVKEERALGRHALEDT